MDYAKEYDRMVEQSNKQQETIESLRQQLAEKDAEIRNLALDYLSVDGQALEHWTAAAASQAREQQLRDTLEFFFPDWKNYDSLSWRHKVKEALSTPSDTTALEAMIDKAGEVMRERCCEDVALWNGTHNVVADLRDLPGVTLEDLK